jgi:uncharacterized repeat protein (TIGR04076 family)
MPGCKITVLKRTFHQDLVNMYKTEEAARQMGPCSLFHDGQEFLIDSPWSPPEGFCAWAWADIRTYVLTACCGGEFPRSNPSDTFIACCTMVIALSSSKWNEASNDYGMRPG